MSAAKLAAITTLAPIFKNTVETLAGGIADYHRSFGRGMENIMGAVADRIRGSAKPGPK